MIVEANARRGADYASGNVVTSKKVSARRDR